MLEALKLPLGQLLALFKVALTESLAGLVEKDLRARLLTTGEPRSRSVKKRRLRTTGW